MYFRGTCFFATVLLSIWVVHCDKVSKIDVYFIDRNKEETQMAQKIVEID